MVGIMPGFAEKRVALVPDTLIAFVAKAGATANDGNGEHSPFAAALLKHLAAPGLDVRLALGEVREAVMASTSPRQEPFVYGSLGGRTISIVDAPASSYVVVSSASPQQMVGDPVCHERRSRGLHSARSVAQASTNSSGFVSLIPGLRRGAAASHAFG
jgi:uncharacterized caspase-like protein